MIDSASNRHYGALNDRFDGRVARLFKLGFRCERLEDWDITVYWRKDPARPNRKQTLASSFVMNADEIVWSDRLAELAR